MRVDLHNHTPLCNHATGEPREFIKKALNLGIDTFGFSCHAPMNYDEKYRMSFADLPNYFSTIDELRAEFKGKIEILKALEVDFILGRSDLLDSRVLDSEVDYLIGSIHFLPHTQMKDEQNLWGFDNPEFLREYAKIDELGAWEKYIDSNIKMAQSGLFNIAGHIDLLKVFGAKPKEELKPNIKQMLLAFKENKMAIELNSAGLRKPIKECYPSFEILEMAFEINLPITFSSDAHSIEQVGFGYESAVELAKRVGYKKCVKFVQKEMIEVEF